MLNLYFVCNFVLAAQVKSIQLVLLFVLCYHLDGCMMFGCLEYLDVKLVKVLSVV